MPSSSPSTPTKWQRKKDQKLQKQPEKKRPKVEKPKKPSLKATFAPTKSEIDRRPIVFFDITIDAVPAGTIFFELFNETVPKTAENFRALATGKLYFGRIFVLFLFCFGPILIILIFSNFRPVWYDFGSVLFLRYFDNNLSLI